MKQEQLRLNNSKIKNELNNNLGLDTEKIIYNDK